MKTIAELKSFFIREFVTIWNALVLFFLVTSLFTSHWFFYLWLPMGIIGIIDGYRRDPSGEISRLGLAVAISAPVVLTLYCLGIL